MEIISWNVNGIRAAAKKGVAEWMLERSADIYCLQETRALEDQVPAEIGDLSGYEFILNPAEKKGYSGTGALVKKTPLAVSRGMGISEFDSEGRILSLEYSSFYLLGVYFPNGTASEERLDYKMRFYEAYQKHVKKLEKKKPVITCGDFNTAHREIDLARPKANEKISGFLPVERAWMDRFNAAGQLDAFREFHPEKDQYTWWSQRGGARGRNVGWRIDYFFLSQKLRPALQDAFILQEVMGSDHCPLGIRLGK